MRASVLTSTAWLTFAVSLGCSSSSGGATATGGDAGMGGGDTGAPDATSPDGGMDSGTPDATVPDSSTMEAGLPSAVTLSGIVINVIGAPVPGATVSSGGSNVTTSSSGAFSLPVHSVSARTVMQVQAPGYAPMLAVVKVKPGVTQYQVPAILQTLAQATLLASQGGELQTTAYGQPVSVVLSPGAVGDAGNATLRVASADARFGPGTMESIPTDGGTVLQSGGMFYVDVVGDDGGALALADGGLSIQLTDAAPPAVSGAGTLLGWQLDPATGLWTAPQSIGDPAIGVSQYGWWNSDRNYRTACVIGHLAAPDGGTCGGNWVRADGPDGVTYWDYSGADGSFCVDGPQTWNPTYINVGTTRVTITMPSNAGDCSVPSSCQDIGDIAVSQCLENETADAGPLCNPRDTMCGQFCVDVTNDRDNCGTCGNSCGSGAWCISGKCTCAQTSTFCGTNCVNLQTDPNNCGSCGTVCAPQQTCAFGTCLGENDAGICANLVEGNLVTYDQTDAAAPTFTGGTIACGTYVLTAASGGSCAGAVPTAATMMFTAGSATEGVFSEAQSTTGTPGTIFGQPVSGYYLTTGSSLSLGTSCPSSQTLPIIPYTATPTQIIGTLDTLYPGCGAVVTFTWQNGTGCESGSSSGSSSGGSSGSGSGGSSGSSSGGGSGGSSGGSSGSGSGGGSGSSSGGDGGVCNTLTQSAPVETVTHNAGSPPTFTGGTIVSGTYYATAYTAYGDCGPVGGEMLQLTLDFSGTGTSGTIQGVFSPAGTPETGSFSYTTSGTSIAVTPTCGSTTMTTGSYTATSNTIVTDTIVGGAFQAPDGGICTEVVTLTLQ